MNEHSVISIVGKRFGRLTVMDAWRDEASHPWAVCRCDCGTERVIRIDHLTHGATRSCGCLQRELAQERSLKHGDAYTRLFGIWTKMRQRCANPGDRAYSGYGGRGISVCAEWNASYVAFRDWALSHGYQPKATIDRINNDGNYEPSNCRWVAMDRQANNRRSTLWVTAFGETRSMADWAHDDRCVVAYQTLYDRIARGMEPEKAIVQPHMKPHDYRLGKV